MRPGEMNGNEIAVIGMAIRAPGAENYREFWRNLVNGVESIDFYTEEELIALGVPEAEYKHPDYVSVKGGMLKDKDCFDAELFGLTPSDAKTTDPQMRLFYECAWSAFEDASYRPEQFNGPIGVYAGATMNLSWAAQMMLQGNYTGNEFQGFAIQVNKDFLATRMSHAFDLRGPSISIQTTCSTSLVAIHMACQSLLDGECDMAIAGGVSLLPDRAGGYLKSESVPFSADGHCRAFDSESSGVVFGEGAGIVVLKPYQDALADGDNITAVIKGSAVNNDGAQKAGYAAPSVNGQSQVIRTALQVAEVEPSSIGYVEAHGTATKIGDPIEIEALTQAFSIEEKQTCAIGTLKSNVGHLNCAAGVAGLIKTALSLKYQKLVPSLHYKKSNPSINFSNTPFYVNTEVKSWASSSYPRRAGVSSFGIGGTNAHVILEEHIDTAEVKAHPTTATDYQLVSLSANHKDSLAQLKQDLANYLNNDAEQDSPIDLADFAYSLQVARKPLRYRQHYVVDNLQSLNDQLTSEDNSPANNETVEAIIPNFETPIVFVFSGQGSGYAGMGVELYNRSEIFRNELDNCFRVVEDLFGIDAKKDVFLQPEENYSAISGTLLGVMKFSFEYSLARYLIALGIQPHGMIGYSLGEYVAACLAEVFSLEDAIRITMARNQIYVEHVKEGGMLAVPLSADELAPYLGGQISLAGINAEAHCTLSGPVEAINNVKAIIESDYSCDCVVINISRAGHSWMVDDVLPLFYEQIKNIRFSSPKRRFISCVSGTWADPDQVVTPQYWLDHLRNTVQFHQGLSELSSFAKTVFIQPGADISVSNLARAAGNGKHTVVNMIKHKKDPQTECQSFLGNLGVIWEKGVNIDWSAYWLQCRENPLRRLALPTYPFQKNKLDAPPTISQQIEKLGGSLGNKPTTIERSVYIPSWERYPITGLPDKDIGQSHICLVFTDDNNNMLRPLVESLRESPYTVITVYAGEQFSKVSNDQFIVRMTEFTDYVRLLESVEQQGKSVRKIVHCWLVDAESERDVATNNPLQLNRVTNSLNCGFYSLMGLTKALGHRNEHGADDCYTDMVILSNNMQDVLGGDQFCPEKSLVIGIVNVIAVEYPTLHCRSVDLDFSESGAMLLSSQLTKEVLSSSKETIMAYRGRHRWRRTFTEFYGDVEEPTTDETPHSLAVKKGGVYLLVGGLGRVGVIIAEFLAQQNSCTLVLTSRSEFPSRDEWDALEKYSPDSMLKQKISHLKSIERMGSSVVIEHFDVGNEPETESMLTEIFKKHGSLKGVVHCTLFKDDHPMIEFRTREQTEKAFQGKVYGLLNLYKYIDIKTLDFFLNCSSLASFLPIIGSAGYIAANTFVDAFSNYCNTQENGNVLSINWTHWDFGCDSDGGFDVHRDVTLSGMGNGQSVASSQLITGEEAKYVLRHCVRPNTPQLVVSKQTIETLKRFIEANTQNYLKTLSGENSDKNEGSVEVQGRQRLSTEYEAPSSDAERRITTIWGGLFGFEKIGIDDSFFELGGDSLKAIHIIGKIREQFDLKIPIADLFSHHTIRALAQYIDDREQGRATVESEKLLHKLLQPEQTLFSVVAVPYAGGSLATYAKLATELRKQSDSIALYSVSIPGNEFGDDPESRQGIKALAALCVEEIIQQVDGPFTLYGHCGGTILTLEIVRQLGVLEKLPASVYFAGLVLPNDVLSTERLAMQNSNADTLHYLFDLIDGFGGQSKQLPQEEFDFIAGNLAKDKDIAYDYINELVSSGLTDTIPTKLYNIVSRDDPLTLGYQVLYSNWNKHFQQVELIELDHGGHYFVDTRATYIATLLCESAGLCESEEIRKPKEISQEKQRNG